MEEELRLFSQSIKEMRNSKFIFAQGKISNLLASIAASENLCVTAEYCLAGFDYELEFFKAVLQNDGEYEFFIPAASKTAVALVFCLLCQFDLGKADFTEFLTKYYSKYNVLTAYGVFCEEVILPFQNAFFDIIRKIEETSC